MKKYFALLMAVLYIFCAGCSESWFDTGIGQGTGNGFNANIIPEAAPRVITCYRCHGDGICSHCNGDAFRDGRRCSVCNGTGYCNGCGGIGLLEVFEINGKDYTVCTSCHGDGTCGICGGTGLGFYGDCFVCHGSGNCTSCKGTGLKELKGF